MSMWRRTSCSAAGKVFQALAASDSEPVTAERGIVAEPAGFVTLSFMYARKPVTAAGVTGALSAFLLSSRTRIVSFSSGVNTRFLVAGFFLGAAFFFAFFTFFALGFFAAVLDEELFVVDFAEVFRAGAAFLVAVVLVVALAVAFTAFLTVAVGLVAGAVVAYDR